MCYYIIVCNFIINTKFTSERRYDRQWPMCITLRKYIMGLFDKTISSFFLFFEMEREKMCRIFTRHTKKTMCYIYVFSWFYNNISIICGYNCNCNKNKAMWNNRLNRVWYKHVIVLFIYSIVQYFYPKLYYLNTR